MPAPRPLSIQDLVALGIISSAEQQIRGVHDDGTNEGVLRVKSVQGDLVKIGVDAIQCIAVALGTSSVSFATQNNPYNSDGSNQNMFMTCAAGSNQGCYVTRKIYGRVVGIRFLRNSTTPVFEVVIDGIAYPVTAPALQFDGGIPSATPQDGEAFYIIADDLPDGEHTVTVGLTPDPAISTSQTLNVYGFLGERRAGYQDRTRAQDVVSNGAVPTSAAGIARTNLKNIRKIDYVNTSGAAVVVTVYYPSVATGNIVWQSSIPAGGKDTYDLADLTTFSGLHVAAASGVNFIAYGRN